MSQDRNNCYGWWKMYLATEVRPFLSDKYDITKHKNYKLLEDYDKRNAFDVEKYMTRKNKPKLKANTTIVQI